LYQNSTVGSLSSHFFGHACMKHHKKVSRH
jgi:hypothetical protein